MKHPRPTEQDVSLALSLSTDSSTTTSDSAGTPPAKRARARARRRGAVVATSGEGEFVCRTCSRAFPSFQALGGHRTSHLRAGRHGLDLGVVGARALKQHKQQAANANANGCEGGNKQQRRHECNVCGLGFEMGQALGGHMRRHREEEMGAADAWVTLWRTEASRAADPPVLLELFA
jgi:hypothetical protein